MGNYNLVTISCEYITVNQLNRTTLKMKVLLFLTLVTFSIGTPIQSWVHNVETQAHVSTPGHSITQKMRQQIGKLESSSFLLKQSDVSDVVGTIKTLLPIADNKVDSTHFDIYSKSNMTSFEWFTCNPTGGVTYTWLICEKQSDDELYELTIVSGTSTQVNLESEIKVMRISFPNDDGDFSSDALPLLESPLSEKDTLHLLDVVKFSEARIMLGHSSPHKKGLNLRVKGSKRIIPQIMAVTSAIDAITSTWKGIVSAFGSSTTQTIQRVVGLGFEKYNQKSQLLKAFGVPKRDVGRFSSAVMTAMGITQDAKTKAVFTAMEYTTTFTWIEDAFTYTEKAANNHATTLMVYKFGDAAGSTADFMYIKVESDFGLADDLLYVTTSKSKLGGLFSSTKTKIERIPHILTLNDAQLLQTFFKVIAIGKLAEDLGVSFDWPEPPK